MDRFFVSDPGLQRLKSTGRTVLVVVATVLISYLAIAGHSAMAPLFGAVVGLMGSMLVNDPDPKERKITTVLLVIPASLSATLGALLASVTWLSDVVLVVIVFLAFYLRRFGPRYLAMGMMTLIPFFFSSILRFDLGQLPWLIAAAAIGVACAYLFRFVLLPDRPERILRRSVTSFRTQLGLTLDSTVEVLENGAGNGAANKKLRRELGRLNECATTAESQLSAPDFDGSEEHSGRLRFYLFDSEVSAQTLTAVARRLAGSENAMPSDVRGSLLSALRELREPLGRGDSPTGSERASKALEELGRSREEFSSDGDEPGWSFQVLRAEAAIRQLLEGAEEEDREANQYSESAEDSEEEDSETEESDSGNLIERLRPTTLQGIQAALAAGLAVIAGELVSPSRSYWVVIAAFVVFARDRSFGETFARGFQRTTGTLFGAIAGFALATVASGDIYLEVPLIFVCIFMAFYLFSVSYALMAFWITAMLAVMYGLLGRLSGEILVLRFEDTIIGVVIGLLISAFVLPAKTSDKIKDCAVDFLDAFKEYVCDCAARLAGEAPATPPLDKIRDLDDKLRTVTQTTDTLKRGAAMFGRSRKELDHLTTALMALDLYARRLTDPMGRRTLPDSHGPQSERLKELGDRIAANTDALCEAISGGKKPEIQDIEDLLERFESDLGTRISSSERPGTPAAVSDPKQKATLRALYYLKRINQTIAEIATEFGARDAQATSS